jgi:DNA-binding MarR family transcriptional regulator
MHFSEEAARQVGLTPQQHQALLAIKGSGRRETLTIGELADALQIRHHSAVGLVNRLVDQALVRRAPGEADRRQVRLMLASRGLDLLEELTATHRHELRRLGPELRTLLAHLNDDSDSSS